MATVVIGVPVQESEKVLCWKSAYEERGRAGNDVRDPRHLGEPRIGIGQVLRGPAGEFIRAGNGRHRVHDRCFQRSGRLLGLKIAAKPPDPDHPYGHGKAELVAALIVSLALMAAALGITYEGIREITAPHSARKPYTLVVLAGVLIIKELLFRPTDGRSLMRRGDIDDLMR